MLKQALASFRLSHFSLACVGLMCFVPFVCPVHLLPLTTFYQEWGAAMLGLCAMPVLATRSYWERPEIPRIMLLPAGLMLLIVVQFFLGKVAALGQALLFSQYLIWAALITMVGRRLREECGLPLLATVMAAGLLLGAEFNALAGVLQHYRFHTFLNVLAERAMGSTMYGNVGQQNHFADYVALGLISLGLLFHRGVLRVWIVVLLAVPLLFVMTLSGSRASWLYLLFLFVMTFLWQRRDKSFRPLLYYVLLLLAGYVAMHFIVKIPWLAGFGGNDTTLTRMFDQAGGHSIRFHIWYEAWLMFSQHAWMGVGFGQFAWHNFLMGPLLRLPIIQGVYGNAHNLVMHVAAEMGLAGLSILVVLLALWIRQAYRAPRTLFHWWGYGLLAVLFIHSMLEFPLWYANFLGIAALILGMHDTTSYRLEMRGIGRLSVVAMLLLGLASMVQAFDVYRDWEKGLSSGMIRAENQILLHPLAELWLAASIEPSDDHLAEKRMVNERAMRFLPIGPLAYKEVILRALSGEQAEARLQLERAIWAYPASCQEFIAKLRGLAQKDPARFAALVEFAQKKQEEYESAVRAR